MCNMKSRYSCKIFFKERSDVIKTFFKGNKLISFAKAKINTFRIFKILRCKKRVREGGSYCKVYKVTHFKAIVWPKHCCRKDKLMQKKCSMQWLWNIELDFSKLTISQFELMNGLDQGIYLNIKKSWLKYF